MRRPGLLLVMIVLGTPGCRKEVAPAEEAGASETPAPAAAPAAPDPPVEQPEEPTPEEPAAGSEDAGSEDAGAEAEVEEVSSVTRNGVPLPPDATPEQIERLWPGTRAGHEEGYEETTIITDTKGNQLAYLGPDMACWTGAGIRNTDGFEVGQPLRVVPYAEHLRCEVLVGDELLHLGDPCPGYYKGVKLVCETTPNAPTSARLFFTLKPEDAERSGERILPADFGDFEQAELAAILEGYGAVDDDPTPPAPKAHEGPAVVFARTKDGGHALTTSDVSSREAIEAALPGFRVRPRRYGGFNIHRGAQRVAEISGWGGVSLVGPGLVDPHGLEVGASFDAIADKPGLECMVDVGEGRDGVVCCDADGERSTYEFELPRLPPDSRWGSQSLKTIKGMTRGVRMSAIVVRTSASSEDAER